VATVHRCLQHKALQYMTDCCIHTSDIARRQHQRSAGCHQLFIPRHRRSMFGRRAFSVAGPAAWNLLPDYLRDPSRSADSFRRDLKTSFLVLLAFSAHRRLCDYAPYKSTIDTRLTVCMRRGLVITTQRRKPCRQTCGEVVHEVGREQD